MRIDEAVGILLENTCPDIDTGSEAVSLNNAFGRVLARDVMSDIDVPAFNRSAMDGYAVNSDDIKSASKDSPVILKVSGEILAGDHKDIIYEKGTAIRVMTGGFIPDGYDCVVMQEDTDYGESEVKIYKCIPPYMNYAKTGEDVKKGELIFKKGTYLGAYHVGVLASLGISKAEVKKSIATTIISTGSELTLPGNPLLPGKIYNNSMYILSSAIVSRHIDAPDMQVVEDDEDRLLQCIKTAAGRSHIIITTGAVSVGKKDIIPAVLKALGAKILFRNVDIQPGTPTIGAIYGDTLLLCLSGNPFAAMANFEVYYWEMVAKLMGCDDLKPQTGRAVMDIPYEKKNVRTRLIRAKVKDGHIVSLGRNHASSVISNMTECNCLIELEAGRTPGVGDEVKIRMLSGV